MDSRSTAAVNSVAEFSNTILVDFDSANSVGLESKIATLEKIIIDQNTKIGDFDVEKQQFKSSIAEMGKNYVALQKDNQMWKNQYKCLVEARIKFETQEFNVLRSAHADKLRETSELNLELTTCQNELESTKDILQKTNEYKNSLLEEKIRLERKCRETSDELSKATIITSNLKNKCKKFQDEAENLAQKLKYSVSSETTLLSACKRVQEQNETLQLSLNSKDHIIQSYMNSCSKLTKEKDQLLQESNSLKCKKINLHKEDKVAAVQLPAPMMAHVPLPSHPPISAVSDASSFSTVPAPNSFGNRHVAEVLARLNVNVSHVVAMRANNASLSILQHFPREYLHFATHEPELTLNMVRTIGSWIPQWANELGAWDAIHTAVLTAFLLMSCGTNQFRDMVTNYIYATFIIHSNLSSVDDPHNPWHELAAQFAPVLAAHQSEMLTHCALMQTHSMIHPGSIPLLSDQMQGPPLDHPVMPKNFTPMPLSSAEINALFDLQPMAPVFQAPPQPPQ